MDILVSGIRMATPLILAGLGGLISFQSGDLNIALEGFMLMGSFFAVVGSFLFENALMGILFAVLAAEFLALIFGVFVIRFKSNVFVVGIAMNLLAAGGTVYLSRLIFNVKGSFSSPKIAPIPKLHFELLERVPFINQLFNNHSLFIYVSWLLVIVFWVIMYKTPFGFHIRAAGEHPAALETSGIKVNKMRWHAAIITGITCGLAGAHLSLGYLNLFVENMTAGRGFIALAAVIFGGANPLGMAGTSMLFGVAEGASLRIQNIGVPSQITLMFPYIATIAALVLRSVISKEFRKKLYK